MFRSLSIDCFRGFNHVSITGFSRISLIIGRNNVGKTAILEALFLLLGPTNPDLALTINALRGLDQFKNEVEDLWGWLFYNKDFNQQIQIQAHVDGGERYLKMTVEDSQQSRFEVVSGGKKGSKTVKKDKLTSTLSTQINSGQLVLKYHDEKGRHASTKVVLGESGMKVHRESTITFPQSIYVSSRGGLSAENPARFSKLEESGQEQLLVESLREIEPRLKRLSLLLTSSGPVIHGDIGIGRLLPLPLMGDGLNRLTTLLLAILTSKGGVALIDEVEVGFHFEVMQSVWQILAKAARAHDVQVFATTHSWECIKSAHSAFLTSSEYDLTLHRLDREESGIKSTLYDKEMIETALIHGLEVR